MSRDEDAMLEFFADEVRGAYDLTRAGATAVPSVGVVQGACVALLARPLAQVIDAVVLHHKASM